MLVVYKNTNQNNEYFVGTVITTYDNFISQGYLDIDTEGGGSIPDLEDDWKHSYINTASKEDVVGFYKTLKQIKKEFPELYI